MTHQYTPNDAHSDFQIVLRNLHPERWQGLSSEVRKAYSGEVERLRGLTCLSDGQKGELQTAWELVGEVEQ